MITGNKMKMRQVPVKYYSFRKIPTDMSLNALKNGAPLTIMRIRTMDQEWHCFKFYQAN